MKRTLLATSFICGCVIIQAQVQQDWVRKFVGTGTDNAAGIAPDRLGNVYICGNNNWGFNTADAYTIRYNSAGTQTSGILYNSPYNSADVAKAIVTDASSNVYVGITASIGSSSSDVVIIKYNSSAVQQWVTVFNTPQNYIDDVRAMAVDNAGNVYITGSVVKTNAFEYDYLTAKFNSSGTLQWYALYNGTANDVDIANAISVDASGNVYVTGLSTGQIRNRLGVFGTGYDYATIKYDPNGTQLWVQRYNGFGYNDEAKSLALDASGNVFVTGISPAASNGANQDCVTIKYDNNGVQQWVSRFAGSSGQHDGGNVIKIDGSGNAFVAGYTYNSTGRSDVLGIKYNSAGTILWSIAYDAGSNAHDVGKAMGLDAYGSMYIAAETSVPGVVASDYLTLKYTSNGGLAWATRYNGPENGTDYPTAMAVVMPNAPPGAAVNALVYVTGISNNDIVTIKYSQPTVVCCVANLAPAAEENKEFKLSNYPNPARSFTNIQYELPADGRVTINLYDIHGRKVSTVFNGLRKAGTYTVKLSSSNLAPGQYHYQCIVESGDKTIMQTKAITVAR